jgi:DNA-binding transcriptional MerR regulator
MQSLEQQPATSRKRKHTEQSDELRECIVRWRDAGMSWAQIIALSGLPHTTVRHIVDVGALQQRTATRRKGGAHHVVYGDDVRACVVSAQDRDAVLRLSDLRDEVQRALFVV